MGASRVEVELHHCEADDAPAGARGDHGGFGIADPRRDRVRPVAPAEPALDPPFDGLARYFRDSGESRFCRVLFEGKIVDLLRTTTRGWAMGNVIFYF